MDLYSLLLAVPAILIALTFHEFAHGYVAYRFGDPTAKNHGRLTLNPLAHLDPMGTIMIFLIHFGWAKPVPVDPRYLGNPKRDMMWIAAAGPLMNVALALVSGILIRIFLVTDLVYSDPNGGIGILFQMLRYSLYINLALAFFNLLPIPPLDGSKILAGVLPHRYTPTLYLIESKGPMVLFGIIMFGWITGFHVLGVVIGPFINVFSHLFAGI
ncbi:MAG: site-2 protease family protein [Candidatus Marinimicrobia bacterium]|jgi:Zn-dependent protease|nr:site-2 protease family protein [Candidatus Neomarinimicrobiota bacterium]MBT4362803.1 site-2 protease family protein [Candidatus Neomarinimicrobiota bacterium]MBT4715007.1 site-2 protease family protein [Candidatus Neomarinimicrobiota bacterium]MBT4947720.1 site-2 protease family protein [Candidatus Neomarinimicrobiota bacterium]MBT5314818.1 site-2 protease family protein [Candidatus Neomarinimicrobiota bacterium]